MNSVLYNVFRRNARNYHFYVDEWSEKSDFVTRKTNLKKKWVETNNVFKFDLRKVIIFPLAQLHTHKMLPFSHYFCIIINMGNPMWSLCSLSREQLHK